jgi:hypothetical protein
MGFAHNAFRIRPWRELAFLLVASCTPAPETAQPIAYKHKIHVAEEEIACTECHMGVEVADHATLPGREDCLGCHEEAIGDSLEEARLVELLASGEPLGWRRVTRVAEHVHFSHRRHVVAGQILCETCHGEVHELVEPFSRPYVSFQGETGMERCIACHKASGNPRASVDCTLCHR